MSNKDIAWQAIFEKFNLEDHNFDASPFPISAQQIKEATGHFKQTSQREVRLICKQDQREDRPLVFEERGLFILPVRNGEYVIVKGEGYLDIPPTQGTTQIYTSRLDFSLVTSKVGNSEMQHLDFAYAASVIRTFMNDDTLVLTIRGRKYTPQFSFRVGTQHVTVESVQTEVDAGYEGKNQVVLIEAKNSSVTNTIIRQLYYPFRQWQNHINKSGSHKDVSTIFFEKAGQEYSLWQFRFEDENDYNSIKLVRSHKFQIIEA